MSNSFDPTLLDPKRLLLLLGLALFLGLAYEGFYHGAARKPPGGIRTFPLLAILGAGLYLIEPKQALAFVAGLLVIGLWLFSYYRALVAEHASAGEDEAGDGLVTPVCNLLAYLLGPATLLAPTWFSVGLVVAAVLLVGARERLHALAYRVPGKEIFTLGQFLILSGIVLPLLPNQPVTSWTAITPYQVWLALVAISALSYGSYLAQRYLPIGGSITFASILGGLYSSTATTVVLSRRLHGAESAALPEMKAGILLATALMYLRLGVMIAIFNLPLARMLAPALSVLLFLALALALLLRGGIQSVAATAMASADRPDNPLELSAAALFAVSFVIVSVASTWVRSAIGAAGLLWLAGIVGVTDIDPFVLNLAQGGLSGASQEILVAAVLIAASSNNLLKAAYALGFAGGRRGAGPALALTGLSAAGFAIAAWLW